MSLRLGKLSLPPPRVVGTIAEAGTLAQFARRADNACDIAEVRLDKIGVETDNWLEQSKAIEAAGWPVIFTLRLGAEGGLWRRPDAERLGFFTMALENLAAIDVELQSKLLPRLAGIARAEGKVLIVSSHDFTKTPSLNALQDLVLEASRYATIVKLATMISKPQDVATLQQLLGQDWGVALCVLGMGPAGNETRTLFPRHGSCLTYGYLDKPTAPGQPSAAELWHQLRAPDRR